MSLLHYPNRRAVNFITLRDFVYLLFAFVLTGGLSLQTEESFMMFTGKDISYQGNDAEIYFEEDDFDTFLEKLKTIPDLSYVHQVKEHSWGQRVIRLYDPDKHIIEIGENMKMVCRRFSDQGFSIEEIALRMDIPEKMVRRYLR